VTLDIQQNRNKMSLETIR